MTSKTHACLTVAFCGLFVVAAQAAPTVQVVAEQDPNVSSFFTLTFADFGVEETAFVSATDITLELDPNRGRARFLNYHQDIDPLTLPGGFSTGDLTVDIVDTLGGSFNNLQGEFATQDLYSIAFTGDLSEFGIESPFELPSPSEGVISFEAGIDGSITIIWEGSGQLANPFDPNEPLAFAYTCEVHTQIEQDADVLIRIALTPQLINLDLEDALETRLLARIDAVTKAIARGETERAAYHVERFVANVERQRGNGINEADADALIETAEGILALITG